MLSFDKVSTYYGKIQALHDVSVEVKKGEIVTLIGANGAGKSTLLMTLCGSPQAASGSIRYEGEELVGLPSSTIMRKSIAVVPEGRRVFPPDGGRKPGDGRLLHRQGRLPGADGQGAGTLPAPEGTLNSAPGPCPAANSRCSPSAAR